MRGAGMRGAGMRGAGMRGGGAGRGARGGARAVSDLRWAGEGPAAAPAEVEAVAASASSGAVPAAQAAELEVTVAVAVGGLSALGLEQIQAALRKAEAENGALLAELEELEEILGRPIDIEVPETYPEEAFTGNLPAEAREAVTAVIGAEAAFPPAPAPTGSAMALPLPSDYEKLKVVELRAELKARGLPVSGRKALLLARLDADDAAMADE